MRRRAEVMRGRAEVIGGRAEVMMATVGKKTSENHDLCNGLIQMCNILTPDV